MENINFKIDHLDPLGQGVSKDEQIAFIEKTLPGEMGSAEVYRKAKGVIFGRLLHPDKLAVKSQARTKPKCPHYYECRGCQYLHTDYNNEIIFKTGSLKRMFIRILPESVEIKGHPANERFGYRNRVQIHYDLQTNDFGLVSSFSEGLINAGECLLPSESIKNVLKNLYINDKWKDKINKEGNDKKGYIEVYLKPGEIDPKISVNKPYAEGGFTQVNDEMGSVLTELVTEMYNKYLDNSNELLVLDIFGGNGNLSKDFKNAHIKVYDRHTKNNTSAKMLKENQQYVNIDLYRKDPLKQINASLKGAKPSQPDLIILDPPRAGVKFIDSYIKHLDAPYIFYISCDPATLKRDTRKITNKYKILEIHLIDLFPGTRHFETLVIFRKQEQ
ncbi:MAG: class I SAM-dependent RNA methyltransferase [Spirochaetales bacterium]|nr:class I SAM-dependent RNA methyltransferase [Spirochaetales bacterium]